MNKILPRRNQNLSNHCLIKRQPTTNIVSFFAPLQRFDSYQNFPVLCQFSLGSEMFPLSFRFRAMVTLFIGFWDMVLGSILVQEQRMYGVEKLIMVSNKIQHYCLHLSVSFTLFCLSFVCTALYCCSPIVSPLLFSAFDFINFHEIYLLFTCIDD